MGTDHDDEDGETRRPQSLLKADKLQGKSRKGKYQKLVDEVKGKQPNESSLDYEKRIQAAAKGYGLSEAANSFISTAYRGQKTV